MVLLLNRIIDGIQSGLLYGAIGLALVLVYRATGLLNFATGEMAMFSTFVIWWLITPEHGIALPLILGILGGVVFGFLFGAGLERFVLRPFEKADHLRQSMVTMGLLLAINGLAGLLFTLDPVSFPSLLPSGALNLGGVQISYHDLGVMVAVGGAALLLRLLFTKTRLGLAMTGAADNPTSASLLGVNTSSMLMMGWGLSSALGALVGALVAPTLTRLNRWKQHQPPGRTLAARRGLRPESSSRGSCAVGC